MTNGGYTNSLFSGQPSPRIAEAVQTLLTTLTDDDLASVDALDLAQPLGTLLANDAFAKFYSATDAMVSACEATKPNGVTKASAISTLTAGPPSACPTAEQMGAVDQRLLTGSSTTSPPEVPASDASAIAQAAFALLEAGKPFPKLLPDEGEPTAVPLQRMVDEFRAAGLAAEEKTPGSGRGLEDAAKFYEQVAAGTAPANVATISRVVNESFRGAETAGFPAGYEGVEVYARGQAGIGGAANAGLGLSREVLRAHVDLGASIGLGGRVSIIADIRANQQRVVNAGCDAACEVVSNAAKATLKACPSRSKAVTRCAAVGSELDNCGSCGITCNAGETCSRGACTAEPNGSLVVSDAIKNGTFDGVLAPWQFVSLVDSNASVVATSCPASRANNSFGYVEVPTLSSTMPSEGYLAQTFVVPPDATTLELTVWNSFQPVTVRVLVVQNGLETELDSFVPAAVYEGVPASDGPPTCRATAEAATKKYSLASRANQTVELRLHAKGNDKDDLAGVSFDDVRMTNAKP